MSNEKKIIFIIPYFGKFNNYFPLWLKSCEYNSDIDWLIFTDDKTDYQYPPNVHVEYQTFEQIKQVIKSKFEFDVSIERPYKLCDYKPAYGYLFEEYISGYKMWGYCDTDMIWGKISDFIKEDMLNQYDKIGVLGHCTLFKNTDNVNRAFMKKLAGNERYKQVYEEEHNHSFDEEYNQSINNIFLNYGYKIYPELEIANIYTKSSNFKITQMDKIGKYKVEKREKAFFLWDNGKLYRYIKKNGKLCRQEYLYIHMQSRHMKIKPLDSYSDRFKIIPNVFEKMEVPDITYDNFDLIRRKYFNLHYFKLRSKNLYLKILKFMGQKK